MENQLVSSLARGGVRQGDPLSPLLFCIAEDVLSRGITHLVNSGMFLPMSSPRGFATPSHLLYADDTLVLCRGTKKNVDALMSLLCFYSTASGQHLSTQKCKFFAGCLPSSRVSAISSFLGFNAGHMPFMYLGVPIFKGKPRKCHLQPTTDKVITKLASGKGALCLLWVEFNLLNQW